jgi:hypothetical protein
MSRLTARPKVFVGSSTEGLPIAREVCRRLEEAEVADINLWDSAFRPSTFILEEILSRSAQSDFGVFVVSPDDDIEIRGSDYTTVRDNVIFETGVFMGALGRNRTFLLWPALSEHQRLPTDLLGLVFIGYKWSADFHNLDQAVEKIVEQISDHGPALRSGYNEIAALKKTLDEREQDFTDGTSLSLRKMVAPIAARRKDPWFPATTVTNLIEPIAEKIDDATADFTFWWLVIYGVITFDNIDYWGAEEDWHWSTAAEYAVFTDRGLVLLNDLRAEARSRRKLAMRAKK